MLRRDEDILSGLKRLGIEPDQRLRRAIQIAIAAADCAMLPVTDDFVFLALCVQNPSSIAGLNVGRSALAVQRKVGSSRGSERIDNFCQGKGLGSWQEQEHGCQTDSERGTGVAAVFG
jgi:hypothetical protein